MLNRENLATETDICRSNKLGSRRNHYHQQQRQKLSYSPLLLSSGSKRNKLISSFIIEDNNTDAILSNTHNNQLVSQPQKSSITKTFATSFSESTSLSSPILTNKIHTVYNLHKTTVPNSLSSPELKSKTTTTRRKRFTNSNSNLTKQKPVNPRAIIDFNCYSNTDSLLRIGTYKNMMIKMKMNPIYYLTALLLTLCALSTTAPFVSADGSLHSNLQKLKISPDIINIPNDVSVIKVELYGNTIKPGDPVPAKNFKDLNMAKIYWDVSNYDARHTLLLLDLDRKHSGNGTNSIYNQFTSLNIPGNLINAGQGIVAFDTPIVPCQPSSKHRILMLAFHQKQSIDIADVANISAASGHSSKRENFKLQDFINRHRLDLVAANVFLAIGETNGVCSASVTLHSIQSVSPSILIAMVTAIIMLGLTSSKRSLVN